MPVVLPVEGLDDLRQDIVIRPVRVQSEVEVLGEASSRAEDYLAQAGAALESQLVHHAGIKQRAERVGQHNVPLSDELVAQTTVASVEIDKHGTGSLFPKTTRRRGFSSFEKARPGGRSRRARV